MDLRFFLLNLIFVGLFSAVGLNLYQLQVGDFDYYINQVQARAASQEKIELRRGNIFFTDKNNNDIPVALNRDFSIIYAVPRDIDDIEETARVLSSISDKEYDNLLVSLDNPDSLFRLIVDKASSDQLNVIQDLKGVYEGVRQYRFYPYGDLASQVIGFVGINDSVEEPSGLYGLEKYYDDKLSKGEDIYLTLDRNLQAASERILKELINDFNADGGTIIIQRPESGEVLSMANQPGFDPNSYYEYPVRTFDNSAVQSVYESGSVFKSITMAMGLDVGAFTPETIYYDSGSVSMNGFTIRNWDKGAYGNVSMKRILERSINTGTVHAGSLIGRRAFLRYINNFGFGEVTGVDLPGEVRGNISNLTRDHVRDIDFATAAFGQGTSVTPIQLINAYSALANGGVLMRPYLNKDNNSKEIRRVISKEASIEVSEMMRSAVENAVVAQIPGYRVAGKTGTAQIPDFVQGGYSNEYIHTYIGFLPVSDPEFTLFIKLDKPSADLAGFTVVPAFKELSQFIINYYNIAPDNLNNN